MISLDDILFNPGVFIKLNCNNIPANLSNFENKLVISKKCLEPIL